MKRSQLIQSVRVAAMLVSFLATGAMAQEPPKPADTQTPAPLAEKIVNVRMQTNFGDIVLALDAEKAPVSVANFLKYVDKGFYNGTVFHRVMPNFMIQGGGYNADLSEKQGLDAPIKNEFRNGLKNTRGTIAMARTFLPDTATAQFFINVVDNDFLDEGNPQTGNSGYAVFGKVIAGMDVVDAIKDVPTRGDPRVGGQPAPTAVVSIDKVERLTGDQLEEAVKAANASAEKGKAELKRRQDEIKALAEAKKKEWDDYVKGLGTPEEQFTKAMDFLKARGVDVSPGTKTPSGLWYVDVIPGDGAQPNDTDRVRVHYSGWLVNGNKVDSSLDTGVPAEFNLNEVVRGWTEGVGSMKSGGKRWLVIPYQLGYGERGRPPRVPPRATLIFELELQEVVGK